MNTETIVVTHEHKFGISTFLVQVPVGYTPDPEELIAALELDFEEDRETLNWDVLPDKIVKVGFKEPQQVHIKPDDKHEGKFMLAYGDETVQDNFDTDQDAARWAAQNNYIAVYPEEKSWNVPVMRTGYGHALIAVSARSEQEAIDKALDEAGGEDFREKSSDYEAPDGAHIVDDPQAL